MFESLTLPQVASQPPSPVLPIPFIEFLLFVLFSYVGFYTGISSLFFVFPTSSGEGGCESGTVSQLVRGQGDIFTKGRDLHCAQSEEPCTVASGKMARHTCLPPPM